MTTITPRLIGLPERERNREVLHPNPTFGIHNIPYDRYQNNKIFKMEENTPSINSRIGMSQNTSLIAYPCETINERMKIRTSSGFRNNNYTVKANNGLSVGSFTPDRLYFSSDLKQLPQIKKIY
tara:strand:+ start:69 stop:440 length:372 start_codon:yes stop_codon:yes gene_type:complete